jgi:hypothetical protein
VKWAAPVLVLLTICAEAQGQGGNGALFGPAPVAAVSGAGGLAVGVDTAGRVVSCRWPGPGGRDQVRHLATVDAEGTQHVPAHHGARWALHVGEQVVWLGDAGEGVTERDDFGRLRTTTQLGDGATATQTLFVMPEEDLLVVRLEVQGPTEAPRLFWYQNWAPCTKTVPQLPLGDWLLEGGNDFAAFAGRNGTLYHVRPEQADSGRRATAIDLARTYAPDAAWARLGPGVWIGATGEGGPVALHCGHEETPDSAVESITRGRRFGVTAYGACDGGLELRVTPTGGGWGATIFCAFGETKAAVDATLAGAATGFADLEARQRAFWSGVLPASETGLRRQCLLTLRAATESEGVAVRAPVTQPPLAVVDGEASAWVAWAYDLSGMEEQARRQAQFAAPAVRLEAGPQPFGSLPAALFADCTPAAPGFLVDLQQNAFLLGGLWRHAQRLPPEERRAFLRPIEPAVNAAVDFLAGWAHGLDHRPLHSFDGRVGHDRRAEAHVVLALAGLQAARGLAGLVGSGEHAAWRSREREYETLVLQAQVQHQADPGAAWEVDLATVLWLQAVLEEGAKLWDLPVRVDGGVRSVRTVTWEEVFPAGAGAPAGVAWDAALAAQWYVAETLRAAPVAGQQR